MPAEPWIKLKIGLRRSGKIADLPSDSARIGWIYVLLEAKVQRRMGMFDSAQHFDQVMGRFGKHMKSYIEVGLLHQAPIRCAECRPRHPDARPGELVVHDYRKEQRDATNADRQAAYRERHAVEDEPESNGNRNGANNGTVTADVTPPVTATVTRDSRARATTATATGTERTGTTTEDVDARNGAAPTLSKIELDAWASFGSDWDDFRDAWVGRGLRLPPAGDPVGDDTSQRGLLYQVLDARPADLVRWVREAKGKTARDVVAHVLEQWHGVRAEAGADDQASEDWLGPSKAEAAESVGAILKRMAS